MNNRTMAHGGGTARVVDGRDIRHKTAAHGGRKAVSVDKRDEYADRVNARWGPYPFRPWPFNPAEPKPRPQTWRNRWRALKRYFASEAFSEMVQWLFMYAIMGAWVVFACGYGR